MKRSFLIGRFLQSHASSYRYRARNHRTWDSLPPAVRQLRARMRALRYYRKRNRYSLLLQAAFALALLTVIGAFNLDIRFRSGVDVTAAEQELVTMQEVIQTRQIVKPPPPPRPPVPVEVPDDVLLEDEVLDLDASLTLDLLHLPPPPPMEEPEEEVYSDEIFELVESMPSIIGGQAALVAEVKYPLLAQRAGIEGLVIVQVVVEPSGMPSDPRVIRSVNETLDEEAVRAVLEQRFTPGMQRDQAVRVLMNIPVRFRLRG